jgi:hypothetical protein
MAPKHVPVPVQVRSDPPPLSGDDIKEIMGYLEPLKHWSYLYPTVESRSMVVGEAFEQSKAGEIVGTIVSGATFDYDRQEWATAELFSGSKAPSYRAGVVETGLRDGEYLDVSTGGSSLIKGPKGFAVSPIRLFAAQESSSLSRAGVGYVRLNASRLVPRDATFAGLRYYFLTLWQLVAGLGATLSKNTGEWKRRLVAEVSGWCFCSVCVQWLALMLLWWGAGPP